MLVKTEAPTYLLSMAGHLTACGITVFCVCVLQQSSAALTVTVLLQYFYLFLFRLVTIMISSQGITAGIPHHMHGPCTAMCARMHFQVCFILAKFFLIQSSLKGIASLILW